MDAFELRRRGLRAVSLDFSMGMLRAGVEEYPALGCRGMRGGCPSAPARWRASGPSRRCSTSHDRTRRRRSKTPTGRLRQADGWLVSVKEGVGCETETTRYGMPRFFQYWSGPELDALLDSTGFRVIDGGTGTSPRADWLVRLAERID